MKANEKMQDINFKVLPENSEIPDNKSETNEAYNAISDSIIQIVKSNDEAVTIGIEGGWGTGKTTMINILREKLKVETDIDYFYYDSWAYEGDPLRKMFLLRILEQIKTENKNDDYKLLKLSLQGYSYNLLLGIVIGFTLLFVPFGTELLTNAKYENFIIINNIGFVLGLLIILKLLIFNTELLYIGTIFILILILGIFEPLDFLSTKLDYLFCFGTFFTFLPVLTLLFFKEKAISLVLKFFNRKPEILKTVSNIIGNKPEDLDSVDFENIFIRVLNFSEKQNKILVLDNLDRLENDSIIKIWSNLQIFFQHRNPNSKSTDGEILKKLWIIIPYDKSALLQSWQDKKLTYVNENIQETDTISSEHSYKLDTLITKETFIDKSIQIVINTPKIILNDWAKLCEYFIHISLINIDEKYSNEIIDVMKHYYKNEQYPSPRIIKKYINQIGLYYTITKKEFDNKFPFRTLSIFVFEKFILNRIDEEIVKDTIEGNFELIHGETSSKYEYKIDLAVFLFKLPRKKSEEILVLQYFVELLKLNYNNEIDNREYLIELKENSRKLVNLSLDFSHSFWIILEKHYMLNDLIMDLPILYKVFWDNSKFRIYKDSILSKILNYNTNSVLNLNSYDNTKRGQYINIIYAISELLMHEKKDSELINLLGAVLLNFNEFTHNVKYYKGENFDFMNKLYRLIQDIYFRNSLQPTYNSSGSLFNFKMNVASLYESGDKILISFVDSDYTIISEQLKNASLNENLFIFYNVLRYNLFSNRLIPNFIIDKYLDFIWKFIKLETNSYFSEDFFELCLMLISLNEHYESMKKILNSDLFIRYCDDYLSKGGFNERLFLIYYFYIDNVENKNVILNKILNNEKGINNIVTYLNMFPICDLNNSLMINLWDMVYNGDNTAINILKSDNLLPIFHTKLDPFNCINECGRKDLNELQTKVFYANREIFDSYFRKDLKDYDNYIFKFPYLIFYIYKYRDIYKNIVIKHLESNRFVIFIENKLKAGNENILILKDFRYIIENIKSNDIKFNKSKYLFNVYNNKASRELQDLSYFYYELFLNNS